MCWSLDSRILSSARMYGATMSVNVIVVLIGLFGSVNMRSGGFVVLGIVVNIVGFFGFIVKCLK